MKLLLTLFLALVLASCQTTTNNLNPEDLKIKSAADNPCIECTQKIMVELAACKKSAGGDPVKLAKCDSISSVDWTNKCKALCTMQAISAPQDETPRMKCLREAQEAHLKCLTVAKTPAEKKACNDALVASTKLCPPPSPDDKP